MANRRGSITVHAPSNTRRLWYKYTVCTYMKYNIVAIFNVCKRQHHNHWKLWNTKWSVCCPHAPFAFTSYTNAWMPTKVLKFTVVCTCLFHTSWQSLQRTYTGWTRKSSCIQTANTRRNNKDYRIQQTKLYTTTHTHTHTLHTTVHTHTRTSVHDGLYVRTTYAHTIQCDTC